MAKYKYNHLKVPDDPILNAKWREETIHLASQNHPNVEKFRHQIRECCRKDFWYWAKGFAYVHEARILDDDAELEDLDTKVPFLPWPHQIPIANHILKVLGKRDVRLVKSRAQGASWLIVLITIWLWLFRRGAKVNLVSKDMDAADKPGDMDSLGAKAFWLLEALPEWMTGTQRKDWNRNKSDHTLLEWMAKQLLLSMRVPLT